MTRSGFAWASLLPEPEPERLATYLSAIALNGRSILSCEYSIYTFPSLMTFFFVGSEYFSPIDLAKSYGFRVLSSPASIPLSTSQLEESN
jgi:hypothetical protein